MTDLTDFARISAADNGLIVLVTTRRDGSAQASVVSAGVAPHPVDGRSMVALVAQGGARKLANLRGRPRATVVAKHGWEWVTVEGPTAIVGPDDAMTGFDAAQIPQLLRDVFTAAGGTHDDWDEYDRVMARDRRAAVFVAPERVYSNG